MRPKLRTTNIVKRFSFPKGIIKLTISPPGPKHRTGLLNLLIGIVFLCCNFVNAQVDYYDSMTKSEIKKLEAEQCLTSLKKYEYYKTLSPAQRVKYLQQIEQSQKEISAFIERNTGQARATIQQNMNQLNQLVIPLDPDVDPNYTTIPEYTIPVVFHVVHDGDDDNILTLEQAKRALKRVNEDLNMMGEYRDMAQPKFKSDEANVGIRLVLAQKDPNGNPTTGVTYSVNYRTFGTSQANSAALKRDTKWPTNKYLNVWIVNRHSTYSFSEGDDPVGGSGYGFPPNIDNGLIPSGTGTGITLSYWVIANQVENDIRYRRFRHIFTHEVGHWLGLEHTWDPFASINSPSNCNKDDGIRDTPNTIGFQHPGARNDSDCTATFSSCGVETNVNEFMNYTPCQSMFTKGQKDVMIAVLNSPLAGRNNVVSAANLQETLYTTQPNISRVVVSSELGAGTNIFREERDANTGVMENKVNIFLENASFAAPVINRTLTSPEHFQLSNLPEGLTAEIKVLDEKTAEFRLLGAAVNHATTDVVDNLTLGFTDAVFEGKLAADVANATDIGFRIEFRAIDVYPFNFLIDRNPLYNNSDGERYGFYQRDRADLGYGNSALEFKFQNDSLFVAVTGGTGRSGIVLNNNGAQPGMDIASVLPRNTEIGAASNWSVDNGDTGNGEKYWKFIISQNQADIDTYLNDIWYLGTYLTYGGRTFYRWVGFVVFKTEYGKLTFKLIDSSYPGVPDQSINTAQLATGADTNWLNTNYTYFNESAANDGALHRRSMELVLRGSNNFKSTVQSSDYTITDLPAGVSVSSVVTLDEGKRLRFNLSGSYTDPDNTATVVTKIKMNETAFTDTQNAGNLLFEREFNFRTKRTRDFYRKINSRVDKDNDFFSIGAGNLAFSFRVDNRGAVPKSSIVIGAGSFGEKVSFHQKFIPVAPGSNNAKRLTAGTLLDANAGFAFPVDIFSDDIVLYNEDYTEWAGKEGYLGFYYASGRFRYYIWVRVKVGENGEYVDIIDYAHDELPDTPITTGNIEDPVLFCGTDTLRESFANDGSIKDSLQIDVIGATFVKTGVLSSGTDYTVSNLPAGLQLKLMVEDDNTLELSVTGNAENHLDLDNSAFTVSLGENIFTTAPETREKEIKLDFRDPYSIIYRDLNPDVIVDKTSDNNSKRVFFHDIFYNKNINSFQVDAFKREMVSVPNSKNLAVLNEGVVIGPESNFVAGGNYPDLHVISSPDYTAWNGKTAYIGVKLISSEDTIYYGWLRTSVAADGSSIEFLEWAYNTHPDAPITTGDMGANIIYNRIAFVEKTENNGSLHPIKITLDGETFATTGTLTEGIHYVLRGTTIPAGLNLSVETTGQDSAEIKLNGSASAHAKTDAIQDIIVEFKSTAFASGQGSSPRGQAMAFRIHYTDQSYNVIYGIADDIASRPGDLFVTPAKEFERFQLNGIATADYGLFYNSSRSGMQLETYEKDAITDGSSLNLSALPAKTIINDESNFVKGGAYPDLHDISNASYTAWNGNQAFVGVRFPIDGLLHYGWLQLKVSEDGNKMSLVDYAYSEEPYGAIETETRYCDGDATSRDLSFNMTNVKFVDIDNDSPAWTSFSDIHYRDFTSISTEIRKGDTYDLRLELDNVGRTNDIAYVWIDWNANNIFEENEETQLVLSAGNTIATASITVPDDAVEGSTRMRIRTASDSGYNLLPADERPCGYALGGEVEDYTVTIVPPLSFCSGEATVRDLSTNMVNVTFADINNDSPAWTSYNDTHYRDFTDVETDVRKGREYRLSLTLDFFNVIGRQKLRSYAWVDWNSNGLFEPSEETQLEFSADYSEATAFITVPENAQEGSARMRIRITIDEDYNALPAEERACGFALGGETEDYTLNIRPALTYCDGESTVNILQINMTNVQFAGIDNDSPDRQRNDSDKVYNDFTAISTDVRRGNTYNLTLTLGGNNISGRERVRSYAWIDWNANGTFEPAEETQLAISPDFGLATATITVPDDAVEGKTRMRLRMTNSDRYNDLSAEDRPCGNTHLGETEDYSVNILLPLDYCDATVVNLGTNMTNVQFGDINNDSPVWTAFADPGYRDYTAVSTDIRKGRSYKLKLAVNRINIGNDADLRAYAWVDWNANGVFEASEETQLTFSENFSSAEGNIEAPDNAVAEATRMRIRVTRDADYNALSSEERACAQAYLGETEDYSVRVIPPLVYCSGEASSRDLGANMTNVTFADINNDSPAWTSFSDIHYRDFTNISTNVSKGQSYTLSLALNFTNSRGDLRSYAWIDWNANGVFEVTEETQLTLDLVNNTASASITVPDDAVEGNTRMRIRMTDYAPYNALPAEERACGFSLSGEAEDYTLNVTEAAPVAALLQDPSVLGAGDEILSDEIRIFPNPATDILTVRMNSQNKGTYSIVNFLGQTVKLGELNRRESVININELVRGVYFMRISNNGKTVTRKIIKQ
ncbi:T9SS type A sorting domain-containing protein [Leptobacterium flavescens]|uniref:T9SS type A sorting domain-containing protein n=1 Tax=Leptobacterium flavescens TaxID=472055 RepID=A0A6P0UGE5_9FLAO|nr:GEVED domain-containing protein [Leptobacterium flavescens]NER12314.1 T9SS type A sorting domain-containing protein [Leptobacterium flavescens]